MQEIWRDISGYESYYQVSNMGNVRSVDRILNHGNHKGIRKGKELKQKKDIYGYMNVCLSKNQKSKHMRVHRLVAMMFIDNPSNKPQINHIDGNKTNNHVENLEWCTQSENMIHAVKTGLIGEEAREKSRQMIKNIQGWNKVKVVQLDRKTGEYLREFDSIAEAARWVGGKIPDTHICQCCKKKRNEAYGFAWAYYDDYINDFKFIPIEDRKRGSFTPNQRKEIAEKYVNGSKISQLSKEYNVTKTVIRKAITDNNIKLDRHRGKIYNISLEILLKELQEGKTNRELAEKYGCPANLISSRKSLFKKEGKLL